MSKQRNRRMKPRWDKQTRQLWIGKKLSLSPLASRYRGSQGEKYQDKREVDAGEGKTTRHDDRFQTCPALGLHDLAVVAFAWPRFTASGLWQPSKQAKEHASTKHVLRS
jgi:hypothetical protein